MKNHQKSWYVYNYAGAYCISALISWDEKYSMKILTPTITHLYRNGTAKFIQQTL